MSVNGEPARIFIEETDLISRSSKKINVNVGKQWESLKEGPENKVTLVTKTH